jgi:dipeptidyl aminopeptidase/acylaminoacyl peptidase
MARRLGMWLATAALALTTAPAAAQQHTAEVAALLFSPDGKALYSAARNGGVALLDPANAQVRRRADIGAVVHALALSADGKSLAVACGDGRVRLLDAATLEGARALEAHSGTVAAAVFSPDGKLLATGGHDGAVKLWDAATLKELAAAKGGERVTSLAFSPDGQTLAGGGARRAQIAGNFLVTDSDFIRLWGVPSLRERTRLPARGTAVAFSGDGRALAVAGHGTYEVGPNEPANIQINQVRLRPEERAALWDVAGGREGQRLVNQGGSVAPGDGRYFALARAGQEHFRGLTGNITFGGQTDPGAVLLLEAASGKPALRLPAGAQVSAAALSPDGRRVAVGRGNGVTVLPATPQGWNAALVASPTADDLEKVWGQLGSGDGYRAYEAVWSLGAAGDKAVAFLKGRLRPIKLDTARVRRWIADLDSEDFETRDRAAAELQKLGGDAEAELRQALKGDVSLEVHRRLADLLAPLDELALPPEQLRVVRAVVVLERQAGPEARALLKALADGDGRQALEARTALGRLPGR